LVSNSANNHYRLHDLNAGRYAGSQAGGLSGLLVMESLEQEIMPGRLCRGRSLPGIPAGLECARYLPQIRILMEAKPFR
jgi:hypothetical protein